jgi:hypothetical protein
MYSIRKNEAVCLTTTDTAYTFGLPEERCDTIRTRFQNFLLPSCPVLSMVLTYDSFRRLHHNFLGVDSELTKLVEQFRLHIMSWHVEPKKPVSKRLWHRLHGLKLHLQVLTNCPYVICMISQSLCRWYSTWRLFFQLGLSLFREKTHCRVGRKSELVGQL